MARLLTLDPAGRRRWFLIWQLPYLVLVGLLLLAIALAAPDLLIRPVVACGLFAAIGSAAVTPLVPPAWLPLIPTVEVLAIAAIRSESVDVLISSSAIALIPILCLAFHFGRPGVVTGSLSAGLITVLPYLRAGELPHGTLWIGLLALPAVSVVLSVLAAYGSAILTERSDRLRDTLAESRHQLELTRAMVEVLPVGLAYHGPDGERRLANRQAFQFALLAGMDPANPEAPATSVWREDRIRRIPPEDQYVHRALSGDEIDAELVWLGEPGEQVAIAASAHQVRSSDGERLGTVVVSLDVTELVESVRVRDQFLSTLSHELRTPLVSVVGYLDLIADELRSTRPGSTGTSEMTEMIETARDSARTLTDRISHLLVAGAEDRLILDLDRVDLDRLVATVVDRHRLGADERGVTLTCRLAEIATTCDPHKLDLVVDNLISNALKHTASGGSVEVALRVLDAIELVVADTGSGLDRHESDRAFDRFYRTESAQRAAVQGLGLGLSISKAVVEAHGGVIDLESGHGHGTTVTVRLPALAG
jgi:two-component system, OmpR family, phosphate regulon sensor histidine kinase PhoR